MKLSGPLRIMAAAFASVVFGGTVHAETYDSHRDLTEESAFWRYLNEDVQVEVRTKMVIAEDALRGTICGDRHTTFPIQLRIQEPVVMADGDQHPTAGRWTERFLVNRCKINTVYNAIFEASEEGVEYKPVAPGTTQQGLDLVLDLRPIISRKAEIENCPERVLVQTRAGLPSDYEPQVADGTYETWTIWGCDRLKDLFLLFTRRGEGSVSVTVENQRFWVE